MEIEVNYDELYTLSKYMNDISEDLKKDREFINSLASSLVGVLHGVAETTISNRIENFNSTQFSKIDNYTKLLGSELETSAKIYNSEENEFEQKMKKEALQYSNGKVIDFNA